MTKSFLKISCGDSNPPGLTKNCLFLENISSHLFSLNILLFFFKTFLSQRTRMFSLFNQSFLSDEERRLLRSETSATFCLN